MGESIPRTTKMDDIRRLSLAACQGDAAEVERLLAAGTPIKSIDGSMNALHAAVECEQLACLRVLIERGADIEDGLGWTPLAHAVDVASDGANQLNLPPDAVSTEIIEYLLSVGADPNQAIDIAIQYGYPKVIQRLKDSGRLHQSAIEKAERKLEISRQINSNRQSSREPPLDWTYLPLVAIPIHGMFAGMIGQLIQNRGLPDAGQPAWTFWVATAISAILVVAVDALMLIQFGRWIFRRRLS